MNELDSRIIIHNLEIINQEATLETNPVQPAWVLYIPRGIKSHQFTVSLPP